MSRAVRERIQRASRHDTNASNTHKVCPNNTLLTAHRGAMLRDRSPSPRSAHIRRLVHVVGCLGGWSEVGRAARGKQDKPPLARTPGCHPCAGRFRIGWRPNNTHMQWDEQESNAEGMRGTGRTARGAHKNAHSRDLHAFRTHQRGLQAGWRPSDSLKLCCGIWAMLCAHRGVGAGMGGESIRTKRTPAQLSTTVDTGPSCARQTRSPAPPTCTC